MAIDLFIEGIPYGQWKARGKKEAAAVWSDVVKLATSNLPKLVGPCSVSVSFVLPLDKFPTDHPYGPDLDNLVKRLFDALNETIFTEMPGKDGAVIELSACKHAAKPDEPPGIRLVIKEKPRRLRK